MATFVVWNLFDREVVLPLNKSILTLISLTVLVHSMSLYAAPPPSGEKLDQIELSGDLDDQKLQVRIYDALIPTFLGMAPMVLYFIQDIVLLGETDYQIKPVAPHYENRFLEILFPLIISPNAP